VAKPVQEKNDSADELRLLTEMSAIVFFVWLAGVLIFWCTSRTEKDFTRTGTYGDSFGILSSLFTGLAAAGAFAAFRVQQKEIKRLMTLQQSEAARVERDRQQETTINGISDLLRYWRAMVSEIRLQVKSNTPLQQVEYNTQHILQQTASVSYAEHMEIKTGVDAIMRIENELLGDLLTLRKHVGTTKSPPAIPYFNRLGRIRLKTNHGTPIERNTIASEFSKLHEYRIGGQLGHVLRIVGEIIELIEDALQEKTISQGDSERLIRTFRSLLSDPELHLILYWGLSDRVTDRCRELIDEWNLLQGLIYKDLDIIHLRIPELQYYPKSYARCIARHSQQSTGANQPIQSESE
jgi:hypothetical protein